MAHCTPEGGFYSNRSKRCAIVYIGMGMSSCDNEPMLSRVCLNSTAAIGTCRWSRAHRVCSFYGQGYSGVMVAALLPRQLICGSLLANDGDLDRAVQLPGREGSDECPGVSAGQHSMAS